MIPLGQSNINDLKKNQNLLWSRISPHNSEGIGLMMVGVETRNGPRTIKDLKGVVVNEVTHGRRRAESVGYSSMTAPKPRGFYSLER